MSVGELKAATGHVAEEVRETLRLGDLCLDEMDELATMLGGQQERMNETAAALTQLVPLIDSVVEMSKGVEASTSQVVEEARGVLEELQEHRASSERLFEGTSNPKAEDIKTHLYQASLKADYTATTLAGRSHVDHVDKNEAFTAKLVGLSHAATSSANERREWAEHTGQDTAILAEQRQNIASAMTHATNAADELDSYSQNL